MQGIKEGSFPRADTLFRISQGLGVSADWLLTGEGEMSNADVVAESSPVYERKLVNVEYLDEVQMSAGQGTEIASEQELSHSFVSFEPQYLRDMGMSNPNNARIIRVKGDSMYPLIKPNEAIIVDIGVTAWNGEGIYCIHYEGTGMIKRLQKIGDTMTIKSDNEHYDSFQVDLSKNPNFRILARFVLGFKKF